MTEGGNAEKELFTESAKEVFNRYYPEGQIGKIDRGSLPEVVVQGFEKGAFNYHAYKNPKLDEVKDFYRISHSNGDVTYVAKAGGRRLYTEAHSHDDTYFIDLDRESRMMGFGCLMKLDNNGDYYRDKPYEGYTLTDKAFRKKGLGRRRILMTNAFSQMEYGRPLYSGSFVSSEAEAIWEKLASEGKAEKFNDVAGSRYAMNI